MSLLFSRYLSDGSANPHFYRSGDPVESEQAIRTGLWIGRHGPPRMGLTPSRAVGRATRPLERSVLLAGKLLRSWNSIVWQTWRLEQL